MQIIDGKKLSSEILAEIKEEVAKLPFAPVFCDVLVGSDPASAQYVRMKAKTAESVGMKFYGANFSESITTEELVEEIKKINNIENMCGLIIQLPLPAHIDRQTILDAVDPAIDVDCLGAEASERFYGGGESMGLPTGLACMKMIDSLHLDFKDKNIAVLGRGPLVGKPVTALLHFRGLTPTVVNSTTENKEEIIKSADLIVSAVGRGKFIKGDMVKPGAIIIDAGTSELDGGIIGDVDLESIKDVAGYVSPVPGGVGPVTVAMLLKNVLKVAQKRIHQS